MSWGFSLLLIVHITTTTSSLPAIAHTLTATEGRADYVKAAIVNSPFPGTYLFGVTNVGETLKWDTAAITPALSNLFRTPSPGVWAVSSDLTKYISERFCAQAEVPLTIHCTSTAITLGPRFQLCNSLRSIPADNLQAGAIVRMLRDLYPKFHKVTLVYTAEPYGEGLTKRIRDDIDGDFQVEEISLDPSAGGLQEVGHTLNNKTDTVVVVLINKKEAIVEALAHYSPDPDRTMILSETGLGALAHCEGTCKANEALSKAWIVGLGDVPPELNELFPGESHPYSFPCFAATQILLQAYSNNQDLPGKDLKSLICGKKFTVLSRTLEFASADLEEGACELKSWNYTITQQSTNTAYGVQVTGSEQPKLVKKPTEDADVPEPKSHGPKLQRVNCTIHSSVCFKPVLSPGTASTCPAVICDCNGGETATTVTVNPPPVVGQAFPQHSVHAQDQTIIVVGGVAIVILLLAVGIILWNTEQGRKRQNEQHKELVQAIRAVPTTPEIQCLFLRSTLQTLNAPVVDRIDTWRNQILPNPPQVGSNPESPDNSQSSDEARRDIETLQYQVIFRLLENSVGSSANCPTCTFKRANPNDQPVLPHDEGEVSSIARLNTIVQNPNPLRVPSIQTDQEVRRDIERRELRSLLVRLLDVYEARRPHKATHPHPDTTGTTGCNTNGSGSSPPQKRPPEVICDPSGQTLHPFSSNNNNYLIAERNVNAAREGWKINPDVRVYPTSTTDDEHTLSCSPVNAVSKDGV